MFFCALSFLDHALGHHSDGVLESLSFITEPNTNDLSLVTQLMGQTSNFGAYKYTFLWAKILLKCCYFWLKLPLTRRMCVALKVSIQQFQGLRSKWGSSFAFLGGLHSYIIGQVILTRFVTIPVTVWGEYIEKITS